MPAEKNTETEATEHRVVGPPGCGKTTWLGDQVQQAVESGMSVLISSLTKAAATEIGWRNLPISFDSLGTMHSHCYHALGRPDIAEGREHLQQWNEEEPEYRLSLGSNDLGEKIDGDNLEPARETAEDELMEIYQICRARMETERMPARVQAYAQRWSDWKEANGLTDFTGLIETCLREVPTAPNSPDVMFVDEAQDLDLLEMSLIRKWGSRSESLYIVGDPDQAIFTWRGADPRAFTASQIPEENRWVLSQSYRVPIAVHAQAIRWISKMEGREPVDYLPRDHEGDVRSIKVNWKDPANAVSDAEQYLERGLSVMFLASCSYMLQPLIRILRETGTPFHNPYRRRNGAWNPLQRRWGQTTTGDRILAFLQMTQGGLWTAEDVNRWTEMVKVKGALNDKGRQIIKQLVDGDVQQVDAGRAPLVGQVNEPHLVDEAFGDLLQEARHQVGVRVHHDDGVGVPPRRLLPQLVGYDVVHQGGLAHAGAGHVEVVAAQQVLGKAYLPGPSRRGVAHRRAALHPPGRGQEHPGAGAFQEGRFIPGPRRVPQGRRLAYSQDAALAEQARPGGVEVHEGDQGFDLADLEARPGGVVVVAVGGGHRLQDLPGPLASLLGVALGQHGDDLQLAVEGDAAHFLLDQQRVVDPAAGLLPAPPAPARHRQARAEPTPKSEALRISPSCTHR